LIKRRCWSIVTSMCSIPGIMNINYFVTTSLNRNSIRAWVFKYPIFEFKSFFNLTSTRTTIITCSISIITFFKERSRIITTISAYKLCTHCLLTRYIYATELSLISPLTGICTTISIVIISIVTFFISCIWIVFSVTTTR
jgi:hypothetical protein